MGEKGEKILKLGGVTNLFAGCRDPDQAQELKELAKCNKALKLVKIDVSSDESIKNAVSDVYKVLGSDDELNTLINNAGILEKDQNRPLITVCNHRCVMDDPFLWSMFTFLSSRSVVVCPLFEGQAFFSKELITAWKGSIPMVGHRPIDRRIKQTSNAFADLGAWNGKRVDDAGAIPPEILENS
uniref:PlsC domain-containing protein n=1 Tax=Globodera pallida TaxID=36090 RepID=A0A183CJL6_GLOPA